LVSTPTPYASFRLLSAYLVCFSLPWLWLRSARSSCAGQACSWQSGPGHCRLMFSRFPATSLQNTQGHESQSDMAAAISANCGTPTTPGGSDTAMNSSACGAHRKIYFWEDSRYWSTFPRSLLSISFQLVMLLKKSNGQAGVTLAAAMTLDREDASPKETARRKKAADDLATKRQSDGKAFRTWCRFPPVK
jgi:hypothetical protein